MARTGLVRWCVTLLTAVCVPLCCCTFEVLGGGCGSCAEPEIPSCHAAHSDDPADCHSHTGPPAKSPAPQCECGGDLKARIGDAKPQVKYQPPALIRVLADLDLDRGHPLDVFARRPVSRAPLVPAMTLLRQHCALTV